MAMGIGGETSDSDQQRASAEQLEAGTLVTRLINSNPSEGFSAKHLLTAYPKLRAFPGCVVDLAYEQYCRDTDAGKNVRPTEFVKDFSNVQQSLYRILEFDQLLHEHPSLVEGVPAERWPQPGESFCEFQLQEQIGRGALSRVFVAREPRLGHRQVVVKVCIRGAREADLLGKLECDGIARIHSVHADEATGLGVICMPYMTRVTMHHLTEWLMTFADASSGYSSQNAAELMQHVARLNEADPSLKDKTSGLSGYGFVNHADDYASVILKWGITLANALAHAHQKNVLHLDVKPGNVLVLPDLRVSLLDFNLASTDGDDVRLAGGTLPYMAAEQLLTLLDSMTEPLSADENSTKVQYRATEATDVFGLCATLWHLVSGEPPFGVTVDMASRREAAESMLERQQNGVVQEQIDKVAAVLPSVAVELLLQGLSYDRRKRPAAVGDLSGMLNDVLSDIESLKTPAMSDAAASEVLELAGAAVGVSSWNSKSFALTVAATLTLAAALALILGPGWNMSGRPPSDTVRSSETAPLSAHETAFQNALMLIKDENVSEASRVVKPHLQDSQNCRRVDLYCRTCSLSTRVPQATGVSAGSQPQNTAGHQIQVRDSWDDVLAEWEQLALDGVLPARTWLNIAYIRLELSDFEGARDAFLQAVASGLPESDGKRMKLIHELMDRQENGLYPNEKWLRQLQHNALEDGSRGEFLAFLTASITEIDNLEAVGSVETDQAVADLFTFFERNQTLVGAVSGADVLMKCKPFFLGKDRLKLRALRRLDVSPPPPHRLHRILLFP
jgi:serine/threonine protein kinase